MQSKAQTELKHGPPESVEFLWVSDLIYGVKIDVEAEFGLHYTNTI